MMQYLIKRRGLLLKIIFFICLTYLVGNLVSKISIEQRKSNSLKSSKDEDHGKVKYIINLHKWRKLILKQGSLSGKDQSTWCDVPNELRIISNSICRIYLKKDCTRLPCHMIYSSQTTLDHIKCSHDGKIIKNNLNNSQQNPTDFFCKTGYSLDLFLKKSNHFSYPSILADVSSPESKHFYTNVLKKFRSPSSVWSLFFNFESIINYPSAANRNTLKLFNITFGYDRSIYDFTPKPWLFAFIPRLINNSRRLSIQQAMDNKRLIHPLTTSNTYWTNTQTVFVKEENINGSSPVTAPILWMNTNCRTRSKRTEYMLELMKYIEVDNYGNCGTKILKLPRDIVEIQNSKNVNLRKRGSYKWEAGKLELTKRYLFTIAIENSITHDYITEKLWHPLVVGSIPIYLGAPNVQDWLPCKTNCIIDLTKFRTPKDAAKYIKNVASNRTLYAQYQKWRDEPISDKFKKMLSYFHNFSGYSIDCILCKISHQVNQGYNIKQIKKNLTESIGRF